MKRKPFGKTFEGKGRDGTTPLVTLRRLTQDEQVAMDGSLAVGCPVGIFWADKLIASVDFDDLFDQDGNRFYND